MQPRRQFVPTPNRSRRIKIGAVVLVVILIFVIAPVRRSVVKVAASFGAGFAHAGHAVTAWVSSLSGIVHTRRTLEAENAALTNQLAEVQSRIADRDVLAAQNQELKQAMSRSDSAHFTLAAVIGKPPHSLYDTLEIDGGTEAGFIVGQAVYANGATPIGSIATVRSGSATVRLFSAPGERTPVRLEPSHIDIDLVGRGGGNFSADVPHDLVVPENTTVVTKELNPKVIGEFKRITSDPRDPFQTVLFAAPVNMSELSYVEVRQN